MPDAFDIDNEVEGLQGQIGRLKQVIFSSVSQHNTYGQSSACCRIWTLPSANTAA